MFDSWFAFPSTIIKIFDTGLHTIAMLKDTPKIYYTFNGEKKSLRQIYHSVKKRRGKAKYLAEEVYNIIIEIIFEQIDYGEILKRYRIEQREGIKR